MVKPVRLQLSRKKGFNLQAHSRSVNGLDAVSVARGSMWGNPYRVGQREYISQAQARRWGWTLPCTLSHCHTNAEAVRRFSRTLRHVYEQETDCRTKNRIRENLKGKNLACWCPLDQPCHADVLLEIANYL